jgi:hypothetical protein
MSYADDGYDAKVVPINSQSTNERDAVMIVSDGMFNTLLVRFDTEILIVKYI